LVLVNAGIGKIHQMTQGILKWGSINNTLVHSLLVIYGRPVASTKIFIWSLRRDYGIVDFVSGQ